METGIDAAAINREMFDTKTRARLEMERRVLDSMKFYLDDQCAVVYIMREMIAESGACEDDLEGLAAIPRQIEGVLVGVTRREKKSGEDVYKRQLSAHRRRRSVCGGGSRGGRLENGVHHG